MKINQNNANINQNPVLLNTLVKQVSDLQIDTSEIKSDLTDLETAVNTHITFNRDGDGRTEIDNLASNDISVSKAAIQEANISHLTSANGSITNLTSNSGVIKNLQSTHIDADDANITHLDVESQAHLQDTDVAKSLTVHGLTTTEDIHAKNIESISLHTTDVETTALNAVSGNISTVNSNNINASNKITTEDLEVKGEITGVSDMEMHDLVANDIKANSADIDKIIWIEQILDKTHVIDPSPELSNVDRYTIQLPKFSGWYIITCLGPNNTIKWAATVRGNGYDYSISWYADSTTECITNLFQYQGQLYIRHSANGVIAFAYSADRDLPDPTIYFNTDTPTISDLATVTDEKYQYEVYTLSGTIFFGLFVAPRLESGTGDEGTINFKGNSTIAELHDKLVEANKGDVWNITDYGYTTPDFVEGAGRPINIDDDVVAVEVEEENVYSYEEDTFFDHIKKFLFRDNSGDIICYTTENIPLGNNYSTTIKAYKKISDNNWEGLGTILNNVTLPNPIEIVSVKQIENGKIFIFPDKYYKVENDTKTGFFYYTTEDNVTFTENVLNFYYFGLNDWVISPDAYNAVSGNSIGVVAFNTSVSDLYHCSCYSFDGGQTWDYTTKVDWAEVISIVSLPNGHLGLVTQNEILEKGEDFEPVFHKFSSDRYLSMTSLLFKVSDSEFIVCDDYEYSQHDGPGIYKIDISGEYITFNKISDDLFTSALRNAYISYSQNSINGSVVLDGLKTFNTRGPFNLTDLPSDIENVKQVLYVTDTNYNLIITDSNNQIYTYYYVPGKTKYIKWDKFAAGVNYEDFRAKKITAEEELISEGTLEVDGDSTFKGNIELDNTTSEISATGNLELSVTGTTTETYTGAKTVTLTAGETINGNITFNGNLTQTGNQNITGDETITGDVTHNGDLTQTGDQDITGSVEISEKETINSLEPSTPGHYETHNYLKFNDTYFDTADLSTVTPRGELESSSLLRSNVIYYPNTPSTPFYTIKSGEYFGYTPNPGPSYGYIDDNNNVIFFFYAGGGRGIYEISTALETEPIGYVLEPVSDRQMKYMFRSNSSVGRVLEQGRLYWRDQNGNFYTQLPNSYNTVDIITDSGTISRLQSAYDNGYFHKCSYYKLCKIVRLGTTISELEDENYGTELNASYAGDEGAPIFTYYNEDPENRMGNVNTAQYKELIAEPDPNATYDDNNEVLTVKGNERITRDLKVQGNIFGDSNHKAYLPNIKSDSIELGDGVVRKIAKNAQSGIVTYDATNAKFVSGDDLTIPGDLVVDGQITARRDVSISGDLYVNGTEHINDVETVQSSDDYFVLRHNKSTALGANEHAGIAVHNYALDKTATLTTDNQGIWRVADNSETSTVYTNVSYYNGDYFTGLTQTATTVIDGIKTAYSQDELDECALYNGSYYHFDGINWYGVSLVDNVLTVGAKVEDAAVITALEALTRNDLVYYRSLTVTVINELQNQPLLTRAEEADLAESDILAWDATNKKAVHLVRPTLSNQTLKSKITNGVITYEWGNSGSAGVAFVGTRAQYDVAKLIPEGQDGFIPPNSIVKITDEDDYVTGENK